MAIGLNVKQLSNIVDLGAEVGETQVVVDVQSCDSHQVDTIQGAQEGVGDEHAFCLLDELGEGERVKGLQGRPFDGSDLGQFVEAES